MEITLECIITGIKSIDITPEILFTFYPALSPFTPTRRIGPLNLNRLWALRPIDKTEDEHLTLA